MEDGNLQLIKIGSEVLDSLSVGKGIAVLALGELEGLLSEFDVSEILKMSGDFNQLRIAHLPSCGSSVGNAHKLDIEDKSSVSWDSRRGAHSAVTVLGLECELSLLAELHAHDTNVPSVDDLASADIDLESLLINGAVENSTIGKSSSVMYEDFLAFKDGRAVFSDSDDLLDNTSVFGGKVNNVTWLLCRDSGYVSFDHGFVRVVCFI